MKTSLLILFFLGAFVTAHAEDGAIWYAASKAQIQKSIQVANITATGADIEWTYTNPPEGEPVRYWSDSKNIHTSSEKCKSSLLCIHLSQLSPATTYEFRLPTYSTHEDGSRAGLVYEVGGSFRTADSSGDGGVLLTTTTTPQRITIQYDGPAIPEDITKLQAALEPAPHKVNAQATATVSVASEHETIHPTTTVDVATPPSQSPWFLRVWRHLISIFSIWH